MNHVIIKEHIFNLICPVKTDICYIKKNIIFHMTSAISYLTEVIGVIRRKYAISRSLGGYIIANYWCFVQVHARGYERWLDASDKQPRGGG